MRVIRIVVIATLGVALAALIGGTSQASSTMADFPRCCYPGHPN